MSELIERQENEKITSLQLSKKVKIRILEHLSECFFTKQNNS